MIGDVRTDGDVARILQQGLAPVALPEVAGLDLAARYRVGGPGEVGGDWYDVLDLPHAGVAFVIGDVAGRGIPAATTMGHLRHALRAYVLEDDSPASVLRRLNRLAQWILPGEVATAIVAIVDPDNERVSIASAGHPPPLLIAEDTSEYLEVQGGPALGLSEKAEYVDTVRPLDGCALLFFTDGLVERRGESIDDGLARLASTTRSKPWNSRFLDDLLAEVPDPDGADDLAVIAVRRTPSG